MHFSIKASVGSGVPKPIPHLWAQGNSKGWAGGGTGISAVPMAASEKAHSGDGGGVQGPQGLCEWLVSLATVEWTQ